MLKNYIKTALRNFYRQRLYVAINIFGLAMGLACCMIISLWILSELNYDKSSTFIVYLMP
jgi:putative ABC transport system permease protein